MQSSKSLIRCLRASNGLILPTRVATSISRPSFQTARPLLSSLQYNKPAANIFRRFNSNSSDSPSPRPLTDHLSSPSNDAANAEQNTARRAEEPAYRITFTCKPCQTRSTHTMSKHGYHKGTVLITCPECKSRHIIADHLGIFMDEKTTLEDILAKAGNNVTKGYVEGDMEFWEDGTVYKTGTDEKPPEASSKGTP
ncbi:DNL zinc finger-domain-containing protein [Talaromyces proteolyticus]|uniref:DNL zinc finger-domain-containing protein n=1 Tax=Talaromyces proteolyticus TaxID=1131652 RepID=A0AAD4L6L5_9EURO|nr:DNL zinc finger-domain-containing protein [Talaromyces proteolyticus]KAH8705530.1 DNL zinc finger-domain-containing protein [Talaromyces proteolyticus]